MSAQSLQATINVPDLLSALEPFIRRVVREELAAAKSNPDTFQLEPGSPLYEDMEEILQRKAQGKIELFSHEEVWGERLASHRLHPKGMIKSGPDTQRQLAQAKSS